MTKCCTVVTILKVKLKILENKGAETATNNTIMKVALCNNDLHHVQVLLTKLTNKQQYRDKIKGYVDYLINNQQKTPKGLLFIDMWGTLRHAANAALIMLQVNTHLY